MYNGRVIGWFFIVGTIHFSMCLNFMMRGSWCMMMMMIWLIKQLKIMRSMFVQVLNKLSNNFYLDDNDDDYYDDGWNDELADDEHLVDLNCDNSHFESDELALSSVYSFLVDDKNHSHYPIAKLPHYKQCRIT